MKTGMTLTQLATEVERQHEAKRQALDAQTGIIGPGDRDREAHQYEGHDGESVGERAHREVWTGEPPVAVITDPGRDGYRSVNDHVIFVPGSLHREAGVGRAGETLAAQQRRLARPGAARKPHAR